MPEIVFVPRSKKTILSTAQRTVLTSYEEGTPNPDDGDGQTGGGGGSGGSGAALATTTPPAVAAAGAAGTATTAARGDHTHAHGSQGGGGLHAAASGSSAGFMTVAMHDKLTGIEEAATAGPALSSATPAALGTAAAGTASSAARGDHRHAHGDLAGGALHALADANNAGFMSAAHFTKVEGFTGDGGGGEMSGAAALLHDQADLRANADVDSSELYAVNFAGYRAVALSAPSNSYSRYLQGNLWANRCYGSFGSTVSMAAIVNYGTGATHQSLAAAGTTLLGQHDRHRVLTASTANALAGRVLDRPVARGSNNRWGGFFSFFRFIPHSNSPAGHSIIGLLPDTAGTGMGNRDLISGQFSYTGQFIGFVPATNAQHLLTIHLISHEEPASGSTAPTREDTGLEVVASSSMFEAALYCPPGGSSIRWRIRRLMSAETSPWVSGERTIIPAAGTPLYVGTHLRASDAGVQSFIDLLTMYAEHLS